MKQLSPTQAGYIRGPGVRIYCASCVFYVPFSPGARGPAHPLGVARPFGTCQLVTGPIDPDGCCNLWRQHRGEYPNQWVSGAEADTLLGG